MKESDDSYPLQTANSIVCCPAPKDRVVAVSIEPELDNSRRCIEQNINAQIIFFPIEESNIKAPQAVPNDLIATRSFRVIKNGQPQNPFHPLFSDQIEDATQRIHAILP